MVFKARSVATPKDHMPVGSKRPQTGDHMTFAVVGGERVTKTFTEPRQPKHEVWLCEQEVGKKKPTKLRKLHEAIGPTSKQVCEDFARLWTPDSAELAPPQCQADGKTIKPDLSPEVQPCLL